MSLSGPIVSGDHAQELLIPHLGQTERLFRDALRTLDKNADCQIYPAADLSIPYDAIRLAGGFATGCVIDWDCSVPIVPIDTTMNIDTSSIFWLRGDPGEAFSATAIDDLRTRIELDSSYEWNLNRGNHFILLCRREVDGRMALVLHSNEKEFKDQYNGLNPTPGNWYENSIRTFGDAGSLRLLVGKKAELFAGLAHMLEDFNILRHRFIATMLLDGVCAIEEESHKHHYFMPTTSSAAIGCYLCSPSEEVPVFSTLGNPISIFRAGAGGKNEIDLGGYGRAIVVPHGWGITTRRQVTMERGVGVLVFNGRRYPLRAGVSLLDDPDVVPRVFQGGGEEFLSEISHHAPGEITATLAQIASYSRHGFRTH